MTRMFTLVMLAVFALSGCALQGELLKDATAAKARFDAAATARPDLASKIQPYSKCLGGLIASLQGIGQTGGTSAPAGLIDFGAEGILFALTLEGSGGGLVSCDTLNGSLLRRGGSALSPLKF